MAAAIMAVARPRVLGLRSRVGACRQVRWQHMVMPTALGSTMSSAPCQRFHNISYDKTDFSRHNHRFFYASRRKYLRLKCSDFRFHPLRYFCVSIIQQWRTFICGRLHCPLLLVPLHHVSSISRFIIIHDNTRRYNRRKIMVGCYLEMRWSKERSCVAAKP
jgi:hypothetical protein